MTHPSLGYANFRFDGDDAVHMPATPTATVTVACRAGNDHTAADQPFDVDAAVTCPNCRQALEADWWMALMENERRTGEVSSLTGTLEDVSSAMQRLLSQTDAVVEETLLGGGASMIEQPQDHSPTEWSVALWESLALGETPPIPASVQEQLAARLKPSPLVRPMKGIATGNTDYMLAMARQLEAAHESMARQLASSPLADLRRYQLRHGEWTMDVTPSLAQDAPLADPGSERVRRAIEEAEDVLAEHPFGPDIDEVEFTPYDPTPEQLASAHKQMAAAIYPHLSGGRNWCHVHNRAALQGLETCVECGAVGHD